MSDLEYNSYMPDLEYKSYMPDLEYNSYMSDLANDCKLRVFSASSFTTSSHDC